MMRRAQTLIVSLLAIFITFVIAFTSLTITPRMFQTTALEVAILSLNETIKGCFAYATDKKWNNILINQQLIKSANSEDVNLNAQTYFDECIKYTILYLEKLYQIRITLTKNIHFEDNNNYYNIIASITRDEYKLQVNFKRNIFIYVNKIEIKETSTFKILSINFSLKGFSSNYVKVQVYLLENNLYKKISDVYLLPENMAQNQYIIDVGIEPKYLVSGRDDTGLLVFLVRVIDDDGASVWWRGEVAVRDVTAP